MIKAAIPVSNNEIPLKGDCGDYDPRILPVVLDFTATAEIDGDLYQEAGSESLQFVQGVYIDNRDNLQDFILSLIGTGQRIVCPAGMQGTFPCFAITPLPYKAASTGGVVINLSFVNFPLAPAVWGKTTVQIIGQVTVAPNSGAATSRNGTIAAGGVSQVLMAANPARKTFFIYNPSDAAGQGIGAAENIYVQFGAAATVDDGLSFEIFPGGSLGPGDIGFIPTDSINVNAATIAHKITALEG